MIKFRRCAAATLLLTILTGLSLPATAQDGPPAASPTTTTLSVSGKPARGATITLTVVVSGNQAVYNATAGVCNVFQPNTITIYNGNTQIGLTQLMTGNAIASVTDTAVYVNDYACQYDDEFWTTATSYRMTYQIPKNVPSVNLRAVFTPSAGASWSLASQSSTHTYRFAALTGVYKLLLNN